MRSISDNCSHFYDLLMNNDDTKGLDLLCDIKSFSDLFNGDKDPTLKNCISAMLTGNDYLKFINPKHSKLAIKIDISKTYNSVRERL